jgi:hypothetical protein
MKPQISLTEADVLIVPMIIPCGVIFCQREWPRGKLPHLAWAVKSFSARAAMMIVLQGGRR